MPRRLAPLVAILAIAFALPAFAAPAVSPLLHDLAAGTAISQGAGAAAVPFAQRSIDLIVSGTMRDADLEAAGATIETRLPNGVRTIRLPAPAFETLRAVPGLERITASYQCQPSNDVSVPLTGATPNFWTHAGSGVFTGDAGAGVIVGLVDTGLDWSHDDFKNPDGTTRILSLWDQNATSTPPGGYSYGTEWTAAQINAGTCTSYDTNGHGTHVMGTAAGDGSGTGNAQAAFKFIGMAPKADIVAVATDFSTAHILDGIAYIFAKASAAGKNAVVNLSLGSNYGAHDGTETFDTSINALTGAGRIVVVAAGNSEGQSLHARTLVPSGPTQTVSFNVPTFTANAGATNDYVVIDAYYPAAANMNVSVTSPGPSPVTVGPVTVGTYGSNASAAGAIYVENGYTPAPGGDRNVFVQVYDISAGTPPRPGSWIITLTPVTTTASTAWDGWLAQYQLGAAGSAPTFTSHVDETDLVSSPGSAAQVITVGSFVSKISWPALDGSNHSYVGLTNLAGIASYSSCGPLRNGALKPDLAAPGSAIVSSKSAFTSPAPSTALQNPDGKHVTMTGTSMAAPHVTGACALLLAATPNQTPAQLKAALAAGAIADSYTGTVPNGVWGNGKLHLASADTQAPGVTVNSPNGGETWALGSSHAITWTATDNVGVTSVAIDASYDNGVTWSPLATGLANAGTWSWVVPQTPSVHALVRVTARDAAGNAGADASNAAFTLADQTAPTVTLTSPNGGEIWGQGESHAITWTAADNIAVSGVDLSVSTDNGASWASIVTGLSNTGSYTWNVHALPGSQTFVKATAHDAAGNTASDPSNAAFVIQPTAGVTNGTLSFSAPTLVSNRPNPFASRTRVGFGLPAPANVRIAVYSLDGRLVRTLADGPFAAGYTEVDWDGLAAGGQRAPGGVYFCRFESGGVTQSKRMVLQ